MLWLLIRRKFGELNPSPRSLILHCGGRGDPPFVIVNYPTKKGISDDCLAVPVIEASKLAIPVALPPANFSPIGSLGSLGALVIPYGTSLLTFRPDETQ
jgi:hypothetical protein